MSLQIMLGLKLKVKREKMGLTQIEVAEKMANMDINMSRETLSKIENNSRTISALELNSLCSILNIDIGSLFEEDEEEDIVTFFRKREFSEATVEEVEKLQEMIRTFIYQKKIYEGEFKLQKNNPLWEEC